MRNTPLVSSLALFLLLPLASCDQGQNATAVDRGTPASQPAQDTAAEGGTAAEHDLARGRGAFAAGDYPRALGYFRAAAEQGDANAQYYVGLMHANGQGTTRDFAEAAKWYEKAAAQNQADALYALARLHVIGTGVEADPAKAVELYERAAQAYPPGEQRELAIEQRRALLAVLEGTAGAAEAMSK